MVNITVLISAILALHSAIDCCAYSKLSLTSTTIDAKKITIPQSFADTIKYHKCNPSSYSIELLPRWGNFDFKEFALLSEYSYALKVCNQKIIIHLKKIIAYDTLNDSFYKFTGEAILGTFSIPIKGNMTNVSINKRIGGNFLAEIDVRSINGEFSYRDTLHFKNSMIFTSPSENGKNDF